MGAGWDIGALLRLLIDERSVEDFEADVRRQVEEVGRQEPGTAVYGFFREGKAEISGLASYLHVMVYHDAEAQQAHWDAEAVWWWDALSRRLKAPIQSERFIGTDLMDSWRTSRVPAAGLVVAHGAAVSPSAWDLPRDVFGWVARRTDSETPAIPASAESLLVIGVPDEPGVPNPADALKASAPTMTILGETSHDVVACVVRR